MTKYVTYIIVVLFLFSCGENKEKIKPTVTSISESVYASGIVKSKNQYEAYASVGGIVESVYVEEGDTVKAGTPILSISNEIQELNKENAKLAKQFSDYNANKGKLNEAKQFIELSKSKMENDSILLLRQKNLWQQNIGSKVDLEQRELAYKNSKTAYYSSIVKYNDLKRQLEFSSSQAQKNLLISDKLTSDYTLKSEIDGIVYRIAKSKGEVVGVQMPVAVIGDAEEFILEMQIDEYDITKIKKGLKVLVTMDSYKGEVFEAKVTKINLLMNERSKTFMVEAEFINKPETLYPNISFEANIVLQSKEKALIIPRKYLWNDSIVFKSNGDQVIVKTGLKDYQKVEIISGINENDELVIPTE